MTVRVGENIVAGGGNLEKDNITIVNSPQNQMQTVGKINQNLANETTPVLYDWVGTLQEYQDQQIELLHPTWICFITDDDGPGVDSGVSIFDFKWEDKTLDDMRWLRSDTFSWQDGAVYKSAYQHLVSDLYEYNVNLYCWASVNTSKIIYTKTETPAVNSWTYDNQGRQWKTISTVNNNEIDVLNAPSAEAGPYIRNVAGDLLDITANLGTQHTETIAGTSITYYTGVDGHKICMPDQENAIQTIYNNTGVAWFYILDSTNIRFKLPRTKFGFTGIRNEVGDYVEPGLPNITGGFYGSNAAMSGSHGAFVDGTNMYGSNVSPGSVNNHIILDASRSSSIYGNDTTVQPPATEMYLYFYVGEFSRAAIENTAGITAEMLNGKMDAANFQVVTALPANPDINTFYFIVS